MKQQLAAFDKWLREPASMFGVPRAVLVIPVLVVTALVLIVIIKSL